MRIFEFLVPLLTAMTLIVSVPSFAENYSITLKGNSDEAVNVATLSTTAAETGGVDYKIEWNRSLFDDHFLSMRPFKCLPGNKKLWCHTPYPYEIKRHLSSDDFTDLEYDLVFVWKPEAEYGIDLWNGVYYQLESTDFGWKGVMHDYDLDNLSVPPPAGELRPILEKDLHEASVEDHFLPFIEIRKIQ